MALIYAYISICMCVIYAISYIEINYIQREMWKLAFLFVTVKTKRRRRNHIFFEHYAYYVKFS